MPAVISPIAGTRIEPTDGYKFIKGTTAVFKVTYQNNGNPTKLDTGTDPIAKIFKPVFLNESGSPVPEVIITLTGSPVSGQEFEYEFTWDVPSNQTPLDDYIITYEGWLGGIYNNFGDEYFSIFAGPGQLSIRTPAFATVDDVRMKKFNIDDYLPVSIKNDLTSRNRVIENHLRDASNRLREELNLSKSRSNSENYRLFCIYYSIFTLMLASRGEDGSSISDSNLNFWRSECERILSQEKREGVLQGVPIGRG